MSDPHLPERRFRAGDPERDRALTVIQQAYEAGRLDLDELRDRQEQVLQVRFTDEIARFSRRPAAGLRPAARRRRARCGMVGLDHVRPG